MLNIDNILLLQPTSPLRRSFDIDEIFKLRSKFNVDSAVSVTLAKKNVDLLFGIDSNRRLNKYYKNSDFLPRQEYPNLFLLNGSLYLSSVNSIIKNKSFFSANTIGYIMPEEISIDIDSPFDWKIAEFLMTKEL